MNIRMFGGTDKINSVDRCARVRVKPQLGLTDYTNSVRPILVMSKTESWSSKLGGTDYSNSVGPIWVISETESWPSKLGGADCISWWD